MTRIEPRLNWRGGGARSGELRADPADRPPAAPQKKGRALAIRFALAADEASPLAHRPSRLLGPRALGLGRSSGSARSSPITRSQLPPIDQLAVPKRPPNIAILSDDGSLIANRGDTGGPAVRLIDLPPYLPKAFVAIEDRRFYDHHGVDPLGILARASARRDRRGRASRAARR